METSVPDAFSVRTYFVRGRNALVARADFSGLYVDYYLHLAQHAIRPAPAHDDMLKEALAALTLHCASRPVNESCAWTINFQNPLLNLFVAGDNAHHAVVGQIFTENIKTADANLFLSDVLRPGHQPRRSAVQFEGAGPFRAVETYYRQSEQRPARYFSHSDEDYVMVSAQPGCDLDWLASLDDAAIRTLDKTETLSLLEERPYRWQCGCNETRILEILEPHMRQDASGLFENEDALRIHCPRCGARYHVTRETMEAHVAERDRARAG